MCSIVSIILALIFEFIGVGMPKLQQEFICNPTYEVSQDIKNDVDSNSFVANNKIQKEIIAK